jgi:hypothetical protein
MTVVVGLIDQGTTWLKPEDRLRAALVAAKYFSGGVSPPFVIESIEHEDAR